MVVSRFTKETMEQIPLVEEIKRCTLCKDELPLTPNPVFQFSRHARILVVGQAPGLRAHESNKPFNDPSGDRLRSWLGVTREQFYDPTIFALLPVAFCYPGSTKTGDLPPSKHCAPQWRTQLLSELREIRFTLLCGKFAMDCHLPATRKNSVTNIVRDWRGLKPDLLATPHPSGRNMGWFKRNPWFESQLIPEIRRRVRTAIE